MLDTIPSKEELTALVGASLYDVWNKLCALIEENYDTDRLWNTGGKAWKYEYKYRRGVYSYEALRSRLAEGRFSGTHKDLLSPVIRLQPLTPEEMLILVEKLADIHAGLYEYPQTVTQQDMADFIEIEFGRIGADAHITPREVIRDFIEVLDIVYQNPEVKVRELLGSEGFTYAQNAVQEAATQEQFAEFEL